MVVRFGQVVLGPPGCGKTTYCNAMANMLRELGRKVSVLNLDPANDGLPYEAAADINDLINVEEVMQTKDLGPNGALTYCMEFLEKNLSWLLGHVDHMENYLIFDLPGQAELYTHYNMVKNILNALEKADVRLCSVFLVDAHYANDPGKYVSALLLTLNSMLQMEISTVNVLSKVDLVEKFGKLQFGLDYYTEVLDLDYILEGLNEGPLMKKYEKLNKAIADVVTDYSLVSYVALSVENRSTLLNVMKAVDKANGYVYGTSEERNIQRLLSCAVGAEWDHDRYGAVRDLYSTGHDEDDNRDREDDDDDEDHLLKLIARQNT